MGAPLDSALGGSPTETPTVTEREAVLRERAAFLAARSDPTEGCSVVRGSLTGVVCDPCRREVEDKYPLPVASSSQETPNG